MSSYPPPFTPAREFEEISTDVSDAVQRVLRSGIYLLGPELEALEGELGRVVGRDHVIGVGSGTDALVICLRSLGIGKGDEVVVPALTAMPTAAAVALAGATPVFADVSPSTGCLTPETVSVALSPRTAAVIVVHLYGYPAPAREISELVARHQVVVIEDMAQAFGATTYEHSHAVGRAGIAACASFYPTKVLSAMGDAGAILTDDADLDARARLYRSHGHEGEYRHSLIAGNSRLDEIQAAIIRAKLPYLPRWLDGRRSVAQEFRSRLGNRLSDQIDFQDHSPGHAYQVLAARIANRDAIREVLAREGLNLLVHYPLSLPEQEAFKDHGFDLDDYPHAVAWSREELSLPTTPQITAAEIVSACDLLVGVLSGEI